MRTWKLVLLLVAIAALPRLVARFGLPLVAERVDLSMGATVIKIKASGPKDDDGYARFITNRIWVYPLTEEEKTYIDGCCAKTLKRSRFTTGRLAT